MNSLNKQYFKTKETHKRNFKKPWWLLWIGLFLLFVLYVYHEIQLQIQYPGIVTIANESQICIPSSELKIGPAFYGDSKAQIEQSLHKPISISVDSILNTETWIYKDLKLEWSNNHIYFMSARNNKVTTPSGIKIGQSKDLINKILFGQKPEKTDFLNKKT